jgi:hypothetical protein
MSKPTKRDHGCQYADPGCPDNWCGGCEDEETARREREAEIIRKELAKPEKNRIFTMADIHDLTLEHDGRGQYRVLLQALRKHFGVF